MFSIRAFNQTERFIYRIIHYQTEQQTVMSCIFITLYFVFYLVNNNIIIIYYNI